MQRGVDAEVHTGQAAYSSNERGDDHEADATLNRNSAGPHNEIEGSIAKGYVHACICATTIKYSVDFWSKERELIRLVSWHGLGVFEQRSGAGLVVVALPLAIAPEKKIKV